MNNTNKKHNDEDDKFDDSPISQNWSNKRDFYIFSEINETFPKDIIIPFIEQIRKQNNNKTFKDLNIYITTNGGYCNYAFDLITHIEFAKKLGICINTYVTSQALSAGSLIAVTGTNRYVGERAYHLLHFMRGWQYSHNPEMSKRNTEQDLFWQDRLIDVYKKYTKIKDIKKKLLADNYIVNGADECIKLGLADKKI